MTAKEMAEYWIKMKNFCRCCRSTLHQRELSTAYLDLLKRHEAAMKVVEAARQAWNDHDEKYMAAFVEALKELDSEQA